MIKSKHLQLCMMCIWGVCFMMQPLTANETIDTYRKIMPIINYILLSDDTSDRDGDGVPDFRDSFPDDPLESVDTDGDGIGNNADSDDDNDGYSDATEISAGSDPLDANSMPVNRDSDILSSDNVALIGVKDFNYVSGNAEGEQAYLFDGSNVSATINLGETSELSVQMDIYINELKEAETVLLETDNVKLAFIDNRNSNYKNKDVGLRLTIGNEVVETNYRRFMEHDKAYLKSRNHERKVNQLWLNIAFTYDSDNSKVDIYINGVLDSTHHLSSDLKPITNSVTLGSDVNGNHSYHGKMSNLQIKGEVLTDSAVYDKADFRPHLWGNKYRKLFVATGTLYVDKTAGDDNNDGSKTSPFATISAAINKIEAMDNLEAVGKKVIIKAGTYREGGLKLTKSGSVYKPIVIEADGEVIILGSEVSTKTWSKVSTNLWETDWTENYGRDAFQLPSSIDLDTEVRYRKEILALNDQLARPYPSLDRLKNSTVGSSAASFLPDDYGFYVDESKDKLYLRSSDNPNNTLVEIGRQGGLLNVTGDYIVLRGLTFKHDTSFNRPYSAAISGEAVKIEGSHLLVEDCNAIDNGSDGIVFSSGSDLVIHRGKYSNNGRAGIITRRGYANAHIDGIEVSYNQWRNDLSNYTSPDLSGYGKIMFSSRIYIENSTFSHHKEHGLWVDAQNMDITVDNCYFTQNDGALWYEIDALNLGLLNSSLYDNNIVGVRVDSEKVRLINNVMSQENIDGPWGIVSTLYRTVRTEQNVPDVYMAKWLTMKDNIIAVKSGSGKLFVFKDTTLMGATATSENNTIYAPSETQRIQNASLSFDQWKGLFNDTTSIFASSYPFTNDGTAKVSFESTALSVDENKELLQVPITLSKAIDAEVKVELEVTGVDATVDDYIVLSGTTITFRPLERKKVIDILINRDNLDEGTESLTMTLKNPTNATINNNQVSIAIINSNAVSSDETEVLHKAYNRIEAESYNDNNGLYVIDEVGFGRFRHNNWAMYQNVDFGTISPKSIELSMSVPNARAGRTFDIKIDSPTGKTIASFTTIATDANTRGDERTWDEFKTVEENISETLMGKHDIYIVNTADYTNAAVIDWFVFKK